MKWKYIILIASPVLLAGLFYLFSKIFWKTGINQIDKSLNNYSLKLKKDDKTQ
jgi:hypothetical protein